MRIPAFRRAPAEYDSEFMETMASEYLERTPWTELRLGAILELVEPQPGDRILDLGCAAGALTHFLASHGADVVGVDLEPRAIEKARSLFPGLRFAQASVAALPFGPESFVKAVAGDLVEHLDDETARAMLAELRRVLVPGGHAYVTAINRRAFRDPHFGVVGVNYLPRRLADRVLDLLGAANPEGQALSAMHYFSRAGFRRLCAESAMECVADLKRRERLARHGAVAGRLADLWGAGVRSAAFHMLLRRPAG